MKYRYDKKTLEEAVTKSLTISELCKHLNITPAGGNYRTLKYKLKNWGIDTTHFIGRGWNVGLKFRPNPPKPLNEILVDGSIYGSNKLRIRLIRDGIKEHRCENCELSEWMGEKIKLELHHINGDNCDNRLDNLQILCPNCHSITDNFRKSKSAINKEKNIKPDKLNGGEDKVKNVIIGRSKKLCECGEMIKKQSKHCVKCSKLLSRRVERPPLKDIENMVGLNGYSFTGRYYGVSDNTIRKWIKGYKK